MSLDALMLRTIVEEVFQPKTFFTTAGGLTVQTSSCKVRTAGQTSLFANRQLTMILKLRVKPGWVSVLKSTTSFWMDPKKDLLVDPFSVSYLLGISVCDKLSSQE